MSGIEKYLLIINVIGLVLYVVNMFLCRYTAEGNIDKLLTLLAFAGGSGGIIIAILLFDRKLAKDNMMLRVFVICIFIIQIVAYLFYSGVHGEKITFAFEDFLGKHKFLLIYIFVINFVAFTAFAIDKINACEGRRRIRIVILLGLAFVGGSVGAILGMYLLRHKTKIDGFTVGVPLIMIMQIVVIFFLMNL